MAAATPPAPLVKIGEPVAAVSWAPDGTALAAAGVEGMVRIIDSEGDIIRAWKAHAGGLFECAFSPRHAWLATSGDDGAAMVWSPGADPGGDNPPPVLGRLPLPRAWVEHLAWNPRGDQLVASAGRHWRLWTPPDAVTALPDAASSIAALAWRPDGAMAGAAGYLQTLLIDAAGRLVRDLKRPAGLVSLTWSPDGRWLAAGDTESVVIIDEAPFNPGQELSMTGFAGRVRSLAWHSSGKYLATAGGSEILVWDCSGPGPAGREPRTLSAHTARVTALSYQPGGHVLASGDASGQIRFWNARKSRNPVREAKLPAGISSLAWSASGNRLAAGDESGAVTWWPAPVASI